MQASNGKLPAAEVPQPDAAASHNNNAAADSGA
jgi:hypothetical protein